MTLEELQNAWVEYKPRVAAEYDEWDERRLAAIPEYLNVMRTFLAGDTDVRELRSRIDSLGKSHPVFGFGGMSQMFFNQLVNAAEPEALDTALKAALPAPADDDEAHEKLEQFCAAVKASREHAASLGVTQPGVGRVDAFVSFFWEAPRPRAVAPLLPQQSRPARAARPARYQPTSAGAVSRLPFGAREAQGAPRRRHLDARAPALAPR